MAQELDTYDYVIVGGGTAGCLLANRLSVDATARVLLIEAGGKDDWIWTKIPIGYLYSFGNPKVDWCFSTAPEPGLNGRSLGYPRGRVLGGCSSINGMIYMRGQARDYDLWRQSGCEGWAWDDVLPYFLRHEDQWAMSEADFQGKHARGGEWRVERPRVRWEILDAWAEAAEQAGISRIKDFNRGDNEGSSYFQVNQRSGVRWNTSKAFLEPALERRNLTILTNAMVERLIVKDRRVTGVLVKRRTFPLWIGARREVILAAGAIGTPHLLQLSGIGPGERLRRLGMTVQHALPGVGENLQDHLQVRLAYKVHGVKTLNERSQNLFQKGLIGLEYAIRRTGPMTMAPSQLGTFAKSDVARDTPNLQYHNPAVDAAEVRRAARSVPSLHRECLQSQADVARVRVDFVGRPLHASDHPAELPGDRGRQASGGRRHSPDEAYRDDACAGAIQAGGIPAGACRRERLGRAGEGCRRCRDDDLPSRRHGQDGSCVGSGSGRRSGPSSAWPGWAADRGRFRDADDHIGQYGSADADDRGEGRRDDPPELERLRSPRRSSRST